MKTLLLILYWILIIVGSGLIGWSGGELGVCGFILYLLGTHMLMRDYY